jgi:chromosome segregation ATPase
MNDATEFESSLAGTIDFFQNLRRKLGVLEAEVGAQRNVLHTVTTSVTSFQEDRQTDRQTLVTLASNFETQTAQLAKLQTDVHLLNEQLTQVETLVGGIQQDQQQARQTLTTLVADLRTQSTALRQELESALQQQTVPIARVAALEEQLASKARELEGLLASFQTSGQEAQAIRDRMTAFESRFEHLDQNARSITDTLADLNVAIERHERAQDVLGQMVEASKIIEPQLQTQQTRLDELAESSAVVRQDLQTVRQDFSRLATEFETQRQALAETGQNRQDLQKHQDRLRHLETLITKASADTGSTRQILNVLQSDLATQSDTLRELDQTWREGLAAYQDRLSQLENTIAGASLHPPTPTPDLSSTISSQESPFLVDAPQEQESPFLDPPQEQASPFLVDPPQEQASPFLVDPPQEQASPFLVDAPQEQESPFLDPPQEQASPFLDPPQEQASPFLDPPQEQASPFLDPPQEQASPFLTAIPEGSIETPSTTMLAIERERIDDLAASVVSAREEQQELQLELTSVQDTLATQHEYLSNLRDILAEQLQAQQQRLDELETTLDILRQAPANATETDLLPLRETLTTQAGMLDQLQHAVEQQLQAQRQHLDELEAAIRNLSQTPALEVDLQPLHDTLAEHTGTLDQLRQNTQQQFAALTTALDNQRLDFQEAVGRIGDLQQEIQQLQQQTAAEPATEQYSQPKTEDTHTRELRLNLETLQNSVTLLETRLTGQAQAFSSSFEQFQTLNTDIEDLQQQLAKLESSRRFGMLEQGLAAQEQEIAQLTDAVQQIKRDSQQIGEAVRQDGHDSKIAALEERLNQQHQQLTDLSATVEAIRADSKATQEKVLTMAANVAQRIHEFQNQSITAKTAQGEQLQEVEQKLILLQAAVETMETQRKPRRWFSMPATFTTIAFTVGAAFLAVLAQVIWTTG